MAPSSRMLVYLTGLLHLVKLRSVPNLLLKKQVLLSSRNKWKY
ncbi:hypothetical protein HU200_004939 [Digitaria exilis]|uniref:Uncharacterized protein n=1 Tax=Digitaria exilis TaxID=1010633 RepID=A0A835BUS4_9POAL|nr:hypothetical protein HU200_028864 [Digitaria exilis]KAF8775131.1 hypothetical protein HU200_004939 [Digitaria exilis]